MNRTVLAQVRVCLSVCVCLCLSYNDLFIAVLMGAREFICFSGEPFNEEYPLCRWGIPNLHVLLLLLPFAFDAFTGH